MCLSKPNIPAPQALQEQKPADSITEVRRKRKEGQGMAGGTLLTGPSGIAPGAANVGSTSLLGG